MQGTATQLCMGDWSRSKYFSNF